MLTIPFNSSSATLSNVGGKGYNLSILSRASTKLPNISVPSGFIITTTAYDNFIKENLHLLQLIEGVDDHLVASSSTTDDNDIANLESVSSMIQSTFRDCTLSKELRDEIEERLLDIKSSGISSAKECYYAVRSSATCEDLPDASFAGQHDTYLNISSRDIPKYVVECFASLYTSRAISYRQRNEIKTADMAVVVQCMVPNQVSSGVLFTANPLTGQRNEFVLEAIPGLGEALVSGLTEPDRYVVEMSKGEVCIKDKRVGSKKKVIHSIEGGGVKEEEITNNTDEILSVEDIKSIIELGQTIQELYDGKPQDIEWAKANNGIIYIVQSRPITTLFPLPTSTEDDSSSLQVFFSFNAVQGIVSPIYPMGQDVIRKCILGGLLRWITWDRYGNEGTFIQSVAERLYINITNPLRNSLGRTVLFKLLPSIEPGIMIALNKLLMDEPDMTINSGFSLILIIRLVSLALLIFPRVIFSVFFPNWSRKLAVWAVNNFVDDIEEKVDGTSNLQDLVVLQREVLSTFFPMVVPTIAPRLAVGMVPLAILNKLASSLENGNDLVLTITRGLPHNCTTEMDLKLWQVAKTIQDDTESLYYFKTNDADTLARYYLCNGLPSVAQEAVTQFMNEYGMRGLYEIDFGRPRWREEPAPLMSSIKSYVQISQEHAPDKVFAAGEAAAEDAIQQLGQQLGKPWLVSFLAGRTRSLAGIRELPKFTGKSEFALFCRMLLCVQYEVLVTWLFM